MKTFKPILLITIFLFFLAPSCKKDPEPLISPSVVANFSISAGPYSTYKSIKFTDTSVGASSIMWNFGDGNVSNEISPRHCYTQSGDFVVTQIATSEDGMISEKTKILSIIELDGPVLLTNCVSEGDLVLRNRNQAGIDFIIDCEFIKMSGVITIEAGVIVEFGLEASLNIREDASIIMKSGSILSGTEKEKGHWKGLRIFSSGQNSLSGTIEYAGSQVLKIGNVEFQGSVVLDASFENSTVQIEDLTISESLFYGILVGPSSGIDIENSQIDNCEKAPILCGITHLPRIINSSYTNNGDFFGPEVYGNINEESGEIVIQSGTYHINSISSSADLKLLPGVEFITKGVIWIKGSLNAIGTENNPIIFRGSWFGIEFYRSNSSKNVLKYCHIEGADGLPITVINEDNEEEDISGMITLLEGSSLSIEHSSLIEGGECGILVLDESEVETVSNTYDVSGDDICYYN